MEMRIKITHLICILLQPFTTRQSGMGFHDVIGHGEELGKHRPPEGHIEIMDQLPSSREFWESFASKRKPVLFRGVGKMFPAFSLWTDSYMLDNFGDFKIKIEGKTEKDTYPEGALGVAQDTLRHFLNTYKESNKYVVSQLPDRLAEDVLVLPFLNCGTFKERILEANLWLSSGGTKSLLHRDADNAINCLLNGTKDWVMIDPAYEDLIPIATEDVQAYGGFSLLNPDSVDLELYPKFREVPWWYANVTAGDCLYLPYGYWHQVRSYGDKNLAVSVLFSRLTEVDLDECDTAPPPDFIPLSDSQMVFRYDGYGDQTMGNTDPFELKDALVEVCEEDGFINEDTIRETLLENYNDLDEETVQPVEMDFEIIEDVAKQMMTVVDMKGIGKVDCDTLRALTLQKLTILADIMDNDPANTEKYEYAKFDPDDISKLIDNLVTAAKLNNNGLVTSELLIQGYQAMGGSAKVAKEIFDLFNSRKADGITEEEVNQNLPMVLEKFEMKMKAEISSALEWNKAIHEHRTPWQTESNGRGQPLDEQKSDPVTTDNDLDDKGHYKNIHIHDDL